MLLLQRVLVCVSLLMNKLVYYLSVNNNYVMQKFYHSLGYFFLPSSPSTGSSCSACMLDKTIFSVYKKENFTCYFVMLPESLHVD